MSATSPPPTTATTTAATPTTVTLYEAAEMPPSRYGEVASAFSSTQGPVLELGRTLLDQFLAGDFSRLHSRFNAELADLVSIQDLEAGHTQLLATAPLGEPGEVRGGQLGAMTRLFVAEIGWGDGALVLNASFDLDDEITGLFLNPQPELPADPAGEYESLVPFRLPFDGLWFTVWGGDTAVQNYHVAAAPQRHAFDFLVWKDGGTHKADGTQNEHYWAYGQRVLAPAPGSVVTVIDGLPDQTPQTGSDPSNPAGNHVVIEVAPDEYLLIAHLQPGSILVSEGDSVDTGQVIGLVGNSGNTSEPHIHVHLQDMPEFSLDAVGLPLVFTGYIANGAPVDRDQPLADQFVISR